MSLYSDPNPSLIPQRAIRNVELAVSSFGRLFAHLTVRLPLAAGESFGDNFLAISNVSSLGQARLYDSVVAKRLGPFGERLADETYAQANIFSGWLSSSLASVKNITSRILGGLTANDKKELVEKIRDLEQQLKESQLTISANQKAFEQKMSLSLIQEKQIVTQTEVEKRIITEKQILTVPVNIGTRLLALEDFMNASTIRLNKINDRLLMTPTILVPPSTATNAGITTVGAPTVEGETVRATQLLTVTGSGTINSSLTVGGNMTVDTTTLVVDSTNNRVGIGTASPETTFELVGTASVSGDLYVDRADSLLIVDSTNNRVGIGTVSPSVMLDIVGSGSFSESVVIKHAPAQPHTGTWPSFSISGGDVPLYLNPSSSIADGSLIVAAVAGTPKFVVDAEGDIFANNVVLSGTTSQGTTGVAGNLTVEGNTTLGDAITDTVRITGRVRPYSLTSIPLEIRASASQTADLFRISDPNGQVLLTVDQSKGFLVSSSGFNFAAAGAASVSYSRLGSLTTTHSNWISTASDLFLSGNLEGRGSISFAGPASISNTLWVSPGGYSGNVGIGTTGPGNTLDVNGGISVGPMALDNLNELNIRRGSVSVFPTYTANSDIAKINYYQNNGNSDIGNYGRYLDIAAVGDATGKSAIRFITSVNGGAGTEKVRINYDGNVGIGNTGPDEKLDVTGNILASTSGNVDLILKSTSATGDEGLFRIRSAGSSDRLDILNQSTNLVTIASSGNVGIGTTGPGAKLEVRGAASTILISEDGTGDGTTNLDFRSIGRSVTSARIQGFEGSLANSGTLNLMTKTGAGSLTSALSIDENQNVGIGYSSMTGKLTINGNVGIGTTNVDAKLELVSSATITNVASISGTALTSGTLMQFTVAASTSGGGNYFVVKDTANVVYASLSSGGRLSLRRDILSHGATSNCTGVGTPTGGCIDLAEEFPVSRLSAHRLSAGDLVSVDTVDDATASVRAASGSYDKNIIGVVSTAPGIILTGNSVFLGANAQGYQMAENKVVVALAGRVPVKVSDENGLVRKGDYLTSSSVAGVAMKAGKPGRVIGIALENQKGNNEEILVFINPHWAGEELDANGQLADFASQSAEVDAGGAIFDIDILFKAVVGQFNKIFNIVFEQGLIKVARIISDRIETRELCVEDVCVNKDQLKQLLEKAEIAAGSEPSRLSSPAPSASPSPTPSVGGSPSPSPATASETPEPTPVPAVSETPAPTPEGTPVSTPPPESPAPTPPEAPEPIPPPIEAPLPAE